MSYHKLVTINLLPLMFPGQEKVLLCYGKKEAFTHFEGFRFCPGCGSNVSRLCRTSIKLKSFMKKVKEIYETPGLGKK